MSVIARNQVFSAVHTVGGLLPADMLLRISEGGKGVPGCLPADYKVIGATEALGKHDNSLWSPQPALVRALASGDTAAVSTITADSLSSALRRLELRLETNKRPEASRPRETQEEKTR